MYETRCLLESVKTVLLWTYHEERQKLGKGRHVWNAVWRSS